jgi:acyl-CoA thioester hydrolase
VKPFRYYLRVRYGECDAQRVVFNARYGDYMDVAVNEFVRALGFGDALMNGDLDFQLVKQTTEWKAPVRFDQVLEISVEASAVGNTSFTLRAEFRIAGAEPLMATIETVYVLVEAATLRKTPIPGGLREALAAGARGAIVDHAAAPGVRGDTRAG